MRLETLRRLPPPKSWNSRERNVCCNLEKDTQSRERHGMVATWNAQKKWGEVAAGAETNWAYMLYTYTHMYPPTHTHTDMYTPWHTHKIIHNTQTYTTHATHTHIHIHIHIHQKCTHNMWRIIKVGWNLLFCTDKFVLHKQEESYFLFVSTWTSFEWNYNTLDSKPPFLWQ